MAALVLGNRPAAEIAEESSESSGLIMGVQATGSGEHPSMAAAEEFFLKADAGVFDPGDNAVRTNADDGDDGGTPAFDFGFEALAAGAKFVVSEFIGAGGRAIDDVSDTEFVVEKQIAFKWREESWREAAGVQGGPEAVAGPAEVAADGGGVEARVDASEEDDEIFGDEIGDALILRRGQLGLGGFPGSERGSLHRDSFTNYFILATARHARGDRCRRAVVAL
jgi:hypothetical protein